jgi:hypothetical protein
VAVGYLDHLAYQGVALIVAGAFIQSVPAELGFVIASTKAFWTERPAAAAAMGAAVAAGAAPGQIGRDGPWSPPRISGQLKSLPSSAPTETKRTVHQRVGFTSESFTRLWEQSPAQREPRGLPTAASYEGGGSQQLRPVSPGHVRRFVGRLTSGT